MEDVKLTIAGVKPNKAKWNVIKNVDSSSGIVSSSNRRSQRIFDKSQRIFDRSHRIFDRYYRIFEHCSGSSLIRTCPSDLPTRNAASRLSSILPGALHSPAHAAFVCVVTSSAPSHPCSDQVSFQP